MSSIVDCREFDEKRRSLFLLKADLEANDAYLKTIRVSSDASTRMDDNELLRLCVEALGWEWSSCSIEQLHPAGTLHRLFKISSGGGDQRVVRMPVLRSHFFNCLMQLEQKVTEFVRDHGMPAPRLDLLAVKMRCSCSIHASQFMEGCPLATAESDEPVMRKLLGSVSGLLRRLHSIEGVGFGPVSLVSFINGPERTEDFRLEGVHARWDDYLMKRLDDHLEICAQISAISSAEAELISMIFGTVRLDLSTMKRHSVLHGDPGSKNVVVTGDQITGMLDWEDCLIGDPVFDIANLATFHPERRFDAIFAGYGWGIAPPPEQVRSFWVYFLRIALAKTVHRHRFGYADQPGRGSASQRIQLALSRLAAPQSTALPCA